jgi:branched-chain amino acid transport system substrate-binding protein
MHATRRWSACAAGTAISLLLAGCGTSLKRTEIERGAGLRSVQQADGSTTTGAQLPGGATGAGVTTGGTTGSGTGTGGTGTSGTTGPTTGGSRSGTAGTTTAGSSSGSTGASTTGTTGAPTAGPPIVIAAVGTLTGATGEATKGVTEAAQAWVGMVNGRGGVAGHQVKLIVVDDGGDTNRHLQLVKQMVEQYHAVALVGSAETSTQSAQAVSYLESKGVPTVGDDGSNSFGYKSKVIFPAVTAANYYSAAISFGFASLAKKENKKKIALVTCVEASICQTAYDNFEKEMDRVGLDPVYKTQTSVTQPDFTAQCISARNAGAELLSVGMDFNSVRRVVNSCRQQGYTPKFITPAVGPGMEKEAIWQGVYIGWMAFSPFVADTPAIREFRAAMERYQPDAGINLEHSVGWVGAKLFQKALENARLTNRAVTSADVLRGLWAVKADTLGGLTGPLTFPKGKPATPVFCFIGMTISGNKFVNPNGSSPHCQAPPKL